MMDVTHSGKCIFASSPNGGVKLPGMKELSEEEHFLNAVAWGSAGE